MSTELKPFEIEPITYPVIVANIETLAARYLPLTIAGVEDRAGIKVVHEARMHCRALRLDVEKRRKELKASSLEYGRQVDAAAKELTALLEPIESHLDAEENRINQEKERLRKEKEEASRAATQARVDAFTAVGRSVPFVLCERMTEAEYATELAAATEAHRLAQEKAKAEAEEKARQEAAAAAERKAEAERLAAERAEIEKMRREQEASAAAERKRLEEAEAKRLHDESLERARKEAAEKARAEEQERRRREEEAIALEEARRKREEATRPDREKLLAFADALREIDLPHVSPDVIPHLREIIAEAAMEIQNLASELNTVLA